MCGASSEQESMYARQSAFYDTLTKSYNIAFAKSKEILDALTKVLKPIVDKGPNQRGFSPEENANLHTQVTESVAGGYKNAQQTLNEQRAARGGSDFIPSGADVQQNEGMAALAANERAGLDLQVEEADWRTGMDLWKTAVGGLGGVAETWNPNGTAGAANQGGNYAADTANAISAANNSVWSTVVGGLSGIAGAAVGGWAEGKACHIAAALYGGWYHPRTKRARAWLATWKQHSRIGRVVVDLYIKHGERLAKKRWVLWLVKPLFDIISREPKNDPLKFDQGAA